MTGSRVRILIAALAAFSLCSQVSNVAGDASVAAELLPRAAEQTTKQLPLRSGGRLTLQNTRGDIYIQPWGRDLVELRVERIADSDEERALVPLEIQAGPDQIEVASRYPAYASNLHVRVDYRVRVPAEVDLKLVKTIHGRVEISQIGGRATVQVDNGPIKVDAFSGILDATTVNGQIDASVTRVSPADLIKLETINGDIHLRLPGGAKAHFALRTLNGAIRSDVPLAIKDTFGPKSAHETNGVDRPLVRLTSINGDIHVIQR